MPANQSFYSFAAVLIPALLFGGVLVDRWKPPKVTPGSRQQNLAMAIATVVLFVVFAEVSAIEASIDDDPSKFTRLVVLIAVVGGTIAVALTISWPWLKLLDWRHHIGMVLLCLLIGGSSVALLSEAIKLSAVRMDSNTAEALQTRVNNDNRRIAAQAIEIARLIKASHGRSHGTAYNV